MLLRAAVHQFLEQPDFLFIHGTGLDALPLIFSPREQSAVLHLLLVGKMMMLLDICLQELKILVPTFGVGCKILQQFPSSN